MPVLYHLPLDAACRIVRLLLVEKGLTFELKAESIWERRRGFLKINPAGEVPVLALDDGAVIPGLSVIIEYLEDTLPQPTMLGTSALDRAETRRLTTWFADKFHREVTENLVGEKLMRRFLGLGEPRSAFIRAGAGNIHHHLDYIAWLSERRNWLAGAELSVADLAAAAELSCVDYLGDVPWDKHPAAKDWYARIKSRPSFRALLSDHVPGAPPAKHYANLDF